MPPPTPRRSGPWLPAGICLAFLLGPVWCIPAASAEELPSSVREAEQRRIATIRVASRAAVAIFAGESGGGSGVLISPDGYALTNFHVVQPAGVAMQCGLSDGSLHDAVLVGLDPTGDVALVKLVGRDDFPWAEIADSDLVEVGDFCFAAGNPFLLATDFSPSISAGIVSGIHRYQFPAGTILEYTDCLQVDAAINPGNSGGGLFDAAGRVIGVNGRASFEKRGRVNVGVGYAISANQLRNFLGCLKAGRLVDHATLGATVATAEDGRVVVSDILEASDAYRRGLRYDDEIVSLAGRPIRTVNAFKNILGTLPAGWRVPLSYRRSGRRFDTLVRLGAVHAAAELAAIVAGRNPKDGGRQPGPDGPPNPVPGQQDGRGDPPPGAPGPPLPEAVRGLYESRVGFVNHHFNTLALDRLTKGLAAGGIWSGRSGPWVISGRLAAGGRFRIELADERASIDLPTGTSSIDPTGELDANPGPPGSGGLLAALVLWRRLLIEGPKPLGRTTYWGQAPLDPAAWMAAEQPPLGDLLESAVDGVEARFMLASDGSIAGLELWPTPDADPCELRFSFPPAGVRTALEPGVPHTIEVRHGEQVFGRFLIDEASFGPAAAGGSP